MENQVEVLLDQKVYNRLVELQVPPCDTINEVIDHLLFHSGHKSREAVDVEAEEKNFSMEEEIERTKAGVYDSSAP